MSAEPSLPPLTPTAVRKRRSPPRDALFAAFLIFSCFSGSALWIYYQARDRELSHHFEALTEAAVRASNSVGPKYFARGGKTPPPLKEERTSTLGRLMYVKSRASPIGRISVLGPSQRGPLVLFDTDDPAPPSEENWLVSPSLPTVTLPDEKAHFEKVMSSGKVHVQSRPDKTIKVYAPIREKSGRTLGVATAESSPHTLEQGLHPIRMAAISSVFLGAIVALLAGLAIFSWRRGAWKIEERLLRAEQADRLMVQALGQVFYEYNPATERIAWRGDTQRMLGYPVTLAPVVGIEWEEQLHPADRELFRKSWYRSSSAEPYGIEYRVRRADGRYIRLLDRGGVLPGEKNTTVVIGALYDMTALREAEDRLRDVVDAAGEFIWEVDAKGRYTFVSDRVREVLGRTPEEMLGRDPFEFLLDEDREDIRRKSDTLRESKKTFRGFEHRVVRADGKIIWLSVNGVAATDADGNFAGFRGAGMDITARKEAEQALIREKEAANAAVRAKSQFLAMMSHEIRTPLNSVIGFADLLSTSRLDGSQRTQLEMICKSGDALLALLNDILDFSRLESAGFNLDMGRVDVRQALQEVVDLYQAATAAKNVTLSLEVDETVPVAVQTDRARLRQILLNLVGNAVKFTERGSVRITASFPPDAFPGKSGLRIEVRDTGVGIPENKRSLLFQPFSQVDSSTTRRFGGTGLGLAICKRLAELLNGEVGLKESGPDGSLFYLRLAVDVSAPAAELVPTISPEPDGAFRLVRPLRVLVAEDNRVNLLLIRKMLLVLGLESEAAEDGRACLEMHRARPFDVILMDVQMPELDGLSATRAIRQKEQELNGAEPVKIIALTANAMAGDRERCLEAGMDDYLSKPIRLNSLAMQLEKYGLLKREAPVAL